MRRIQWVAVLVAGSMTLPASSASATERRLYQVTSGQTKVGQASLTRSEGASGRITYVHHSRLTARRDGVKAERLLHEEVRVRDGLFEAAWAVREVEGRRTVVRAWWDAGAGVVRVQRDGRTTAVAPPEGAALETLFDAPRRLVRHGRAGARRAVFDLPAGEVGWVVLRAPAGADGWAETDELGVRVRSRWSPGAALPDALELPDVGLRYVAVGVQVGPAAARAPADEGGGVPVVGAPATGRRVRLTPEAAWAGLGCRDGEARLSAAGPACAEVGTPGEAGEGNGKGSSAPVPVPSAAGPRVRALAARIPAGPASARAAALAAEVAAVLDARTEAAALWEADAEQALAVGAGDCNEAAAVFAAAARVLGLTVRRRTGLVLDPASGRFVPHAWAEVRVDGGWVRADPARGEAPATGVYLDLGDGTRTADRLRAVTAGFRGGRVEVLP